MADKAKVLEALTKLDKADDAHWTDDGLPRVNVVQELADDATLTRAQLNEIAPGFARNPAPAKKTEINGAAQVGDETGGSPPAASTDPVIKAAGGDEFDPGMEPEINGPGEQLSEDEVRAILRRRIGEAERQLEAARRRVSEATVEQRRCEKNVARAISDSQSRFPPLSAAENIKQHLKAQQDRLIAEVEARGAGGIGQLDQALQRHNSRGWTRPARPVQNTTNSTAA